MYCVYCLPFSTRSYLLCVCVWAPGGIKILQTDQTKIKLLFQAQLPPSQRLFLKRRYFYEPDAFELYLSFFRYNKCVFSTWLMERQESVLHLRELRQIKIIRFTGMDRCVTILSRHNAFRVVRARAHLNKVSQGTWSLPVRAGATFSSPQLQQQHHQHIYISPA